MFSNVIVFIASFTVTPNVCLCTLFSLSVYVIVTVCAPTFVLSYPLIILGVTDIVVGALGFDAIVIVIFASDKSNSSLYLYVILLGAVIITLAI